MLGHFCVTLHDFRVRCFFCAYVLVFPAAQCLSYSLLDSKPTPSPFVDSPEGQKLRSFLEECNKVDEWAIRRTVKARKFYYDNPDLPRCEPQSLAYRELTLAAAKLRFMQIGGLALKTKMEEKLDVESWMKAYYQFFAAKPDSE